MPKRLDLITRSSLMLAMLLNLGVQVLAAEESPTTPEAVWADFDPRKEPLEIEVMKRWAEHGSIFTEFTFTGMTHEGSKVRVYAISGVPEGKDHLPGILHIHGGGQTVNPQWLRFWNDRGYAALTFNWGGAWPNREKFTDWGKLTQGNHRDAGAMAMATEPSVRASSWYLWTRISRRALHLPGATAGRGPRPSRDLRRLDGWHHRLAAGGDGSSGQGGMCHLRSWLEHLPRRGGLPRSESGGRRTKLWRNTMESESYARLVKCPVLFLDATNDQHGNMDRSFQTLSRVPTEVRWAFTPRYRHHIAAEQGADLPLWMDAYLKRREAVPEVSRRRGSTGDGWHSRSCREARQLAVDPASRSLLCRRESQPKEPLLAVGYRAPGRRRHGSPIFRSLIPGSPSSPSQTSSTPRASA